MQVFDQLRGHEQVVFGNDDDSGLRCIIAIHSTALGPALGGTRFRPYDSDDAALADVLALSEAMTLKNAMAGLDHGGGKAVIIGDPATLRSEALLRAYGRMIASLGGRYISACDVGTGPADMEVIRRETRWVTGMPPAAGGSGDSGVLTAFGVEVGMKAAARHRWGSADLADRHVVVQGLGKVGGRLAASLLGQGASVTVADVDDEAVATAVTAGATAVGIDEVVGVTADILSPNALGGVLDEDTVAGLDVEVVCGGANNQLAAPAVADALAARDILYAPDYVVNAGGVIAVSDELHPQGHSPQRCRDRAEGIADTLAAVFATSDADGVSTEVAARRVARQRIDSVGRLRRFVLP